MQSSARIHLVIVHNMQFFFFSIFQWIGASAAWFAQLHVHVFLFIFQNSHVLVKVKGLKHALYTFYHSRPFTCTLYMYFYYLI